MKVTKTAISGAYLIELDVYGDHRGFFLESYQKQRYEKFGLNVDFVQDNRSLSEQGVLRGLHYQIKRPIGHLVYVTRGCIFDVGLDLRLTSPTFGICIEFTLSSDNNQQLYLPPGVAHGFCALEETNEILYKCTDYYYPDDEAGVLWNDTDLNIRWPISNPKIKARDALFPQLKNIDPSRLPKV
ncbi:MAG TPA: dTDP-4-dehydrorhamnose 3,5-epimerase [Methylophilaceae bacterium]|nr:dTDP-4-dehydrorhamnose 3,5-epimerase [Methylophilaceae bacterium]